MRHYKKTLISIALGLAVTSLSVSAAKGPTLNLNPSSSHSLQFPSNVERVTVINNSVASATSSANSLIINTLEAGSTELEFYLQGEATPRYLSISVNPASPTAFSPAPMVAAVPTQQPEPVSQTRTAVMEPLPPAESEIPAEPAEPEVLAVADTQPQLATEEQIQPTETSAFTMSEAQLNTLRNAIDYNSPDMIIGFDEVANKALQHNPEVRAAWHAFSASAHDISFASAGYRPTVDFLAAYGYENRDWQDYDGKSNFSGSSAGLTLTQSLYDGLRTRNEVKRFEAAQLVRYYELAAAIESTTLQALAAYQDVMRFRELVALAEENLEQHQTVYNQIETSAQAGVARRADLEQIAGRLSLAESNLLTEIANLHDVSARYLRIVGELPAYNLLPVELGNELIPVDIRRALHMAYEGNPSFHAAIRNIESQQAQVDTSRAAFRPQVNLTGRLNSRENDDQGFNNRRSDGQLAIELRYNLYNGGRDQATLQRNYEEVNLAKTQRDNACYNLRQTLQIAINDIQKLDSQLPMLNQHRLSSERVRSAYKNQFDIGQRTLLDVLDSENEFFQASRAYTNAAFDRNLAVATALNEMGELMPALHVVRSGLPSLADLGAETFAVDANSACPDVDVNNSILANQR